VLTWDESGEEGRLFGRVAGSEVQSCHKDSARHHQAHACDGQEVLRRRCPFGVLREQLHQFLVNFGNLAITELFWHKV
jgi:hypothetical protein